VRKLLIGLLVLAVLLVVGDRVAAAYANRRLAAQVRTELALEQKPTVRVNGIPFLTQALGGNYKDVRVQIADFDSGPLQNIVIDARLQGVRAPLGDVVNGRLSSVPVDRITGDLRISYDSLARASGIEGLRITREGEALRVTGSVEVVGRRVDAVAVGRVEVEGSDLKITAERATVEGVELPQVAVDAANRALSFAVSPRELPLSLEITNVRTEQDAVVVSARSDQAVLTR
jgi:hypothetical protein